MEALDWPELIIKLQSLATSEPARSLLRELSPLANQEAAERSLRAITEARVVLSFGERPFAESLDLFSTWFTRLSRQATLQTLELRDLRRFLMEVIALEEVLRPLDNPWTQSLKAKLMRAESSLADIDRVISPSGEIRVDATEALSNLYKEKQTQIRATQNLLDRLVKQHEMEAMLQDRYVTTREGRWVLPIKGGMQHHFPGIIHASSASKQTVFMEPEEIIPLNNRLRQLESEIEAEIERILIRLSESLAKKSPELLRSKEALLEADIRFAQAKLAEILEADVCDFSDQYSAEINLIELRHPLLVLKNTSVIANTVRLNSQKRVLLLSGPNAGGKTVLLKSIGLAAQMARCGLPICAERGSRLPFFEQVHIAVGDAQNVGADLSTFAAHLKILNEATQAKSSRELLLIDEICSATDPEEGSGLARSFIERYAQNKVFAVITSHLSPLKTGWAEDSGVVNGSLEYNAKTGRPTYLFLPGVPGQSLALVTARRVGVDEQIVERAMDFLSPQTKAQQRHLKEIEALKEELTLLRESLMAESRSTREKKATYQELIAKFRKEREQWLDRTVKKAEKKLDDWMAKSQVDELFKKHESVQAIKRDLPEVVKASSSLTVRKKIETVEDFEKLYPPGTHVFVPSINQDGVVQGRANSRGEIPILSNSMRLFVSWQSLKPPQSISNPTQTIARRAGHLNASLLDAERVIDLRGQASDDAIRKLEDGLDSASLAGEDRVKIIHGHGTDTLKKAVRSYLSRSIYVKKWKAGSPDGGGDGITFAELKD